MRRIDDAVRRILRVKVRAGLFENPYVDVAAAPGKQLLPENRAAARRAAGRSMVLLENEGGVLPLDPAKSTAIIGPLGDSGHDMLGPWWGAAPTRTSSRSSRGCSPRTRARRSRPAAR